MARGIYPETTIPLPDSYDWVAIERPGGVVDLFIRKELSPARVGFILCNLAMQLAQLAQLRFWRL